MLSRLLPSVQLRARRGFRPRRAHDYPHALRYSSTAPWVVPSDAPDYKELARNSIHEHGFAIVTRLFSPEQLAEVSGIALSRVEDVARELDGRGVELGIGSAAGFHEVCLRSHKRLDVPYSMDMLPKQALKLISAVTSRALDRGDGVGSSCSGACVVRAEPGCPPQIWHTDSTHRLAEHEPPTVLNVLVAMKDVEASNGPTDILPGSHKLTNHHRPEAKFDGGIVYQNPENGPELIGSTAETVSACMPAGSALIFDDRALHRGGGNVSAHNRDILSFTWRREDFAISEYYEATRSLWKYDHRSLAGTVRSEFPGLTGRPGKNGGIAPDPIFADGASGSQLHESAINAMMEQLRYGIANVGGAYDSSERVGETVVNARRAMADFLNCADEEVVFGASMSALTYHVARALRNQASIGPGSNIVLDPISHGSNVWPWVQLAKASSAEVRWLPVQHSTGSGGGSECILDVGMDALQGIIDGNTALVAAGAASNGVGSVHDIHALCAHASAMSGGRALRYIDAVHFAPHGRVDVRAIGCDMLACSPYKFFGPHAGILFGRSELLATLPVDRLDVQDDRLPCEDNCYMSRWEVGTQNYEALAGLTAAVDYLSGVGERFGGADADASRRDKLAYAWTAIQAHENELKRRFLDGVPAIRGLSLLGVTDPRRVDLRTSTFAVAKEGVPAAELAERLCQRGIWCTAGNHYAGFWTNLSAGLTDSDIGMTRVGFLHYNTGEEVDAVLKALDSV